MRRLPVLCCATMLVGAVWAGPASAASDNGMDLHATSAPKGFRWLPFSGIPVGRFCNVWSGDAGTSVVMIDPPGSDELRTLWVARAGGAKELPVPDQYFLAGSDARMSSTGIVAAGVLDGHSTTEHFNVPVLRWDASGKVTASPEFAVDFPSVSRVVGVTPTGDVVISVRHLQPEFTDTSVFVWRAGGEVKKLFDLPRGEEFAQISTLRPDGSFVVAWNSAAAQYSEVVRPVKGWEDFTRTRIEPLVNAVSADGRWWAGTAFLRGPTPPNGGDAPVQAVFGSAKGDNAPFIPVPAHIAPEGRALAINNQGTMLATGPGYSLRWINGSRWVDVRTRITRLPAGMTLDQLFQIDTAGRISAVAWSGDDETKRCRAGMLAPEW